jgi:hypothetical protein
MRLIAAVVINSGVAPLRLMPVAHVPFDPERLNVVMVPSEALTKLCHAPAASS